MGGWDINCAFCGGPFNCFDPFNAEGSIEGEGLNLELITEGDLEWLETIRVIGFNPDSFTVKKCYITGPGSSQEYGAVDCAYGNDPNVPRDPRRPNKNSFSTYSEYNPDEPTGFPFHEPCFQVFAQALRYQLSAEIKGVADLKLIDKDVLYSTMAKLHEEYDHCLKVDYAELNEVAQEQYWYCEPGSEAWVSNPFKSDQISNYLQSLKESGMNVGKTTPETSATASKLSAAHSGNPFTRIADELASEILLSLPYEDIKHFALSGLTGLALPRTQAFWKRKIFIDMPWLWDLPEFEGRRDFFNLYQELRRQCFATNPPTVEDEEEGGRRVINPRDTSLVLGLANRRRVWNTCTQLAKLYVKELKENDPQSKIDKSGTAEHVVENSFSSQMPLVAAPLSKDSRSLCTYFISSWDDIERKNSFVFHFQGDGRLCGIEISHFGDEDSQLFGERATGSGRNFTAVIPLQYWITGLEFNVCNAGDLRADAVVGITGVKLLIENGDDIQLGANDGDKRRMTSTRKDHVITGAVGEIAGGVMQRFGLLQCPRILSLDTHLPSPPTLQKSLWKSNIPLPNLSASQYETGYWMPVRSFDTIQMQALIFGTTETELEQVTGYSSDAKCQFFGAHFRNGTEHYIGMNESEREEKNKKTFLIDGEGGERVSKVEVGMNHLPTGIKVTTNRDRIAFFGSTQKNYHVVYEPDENGFIAGIYASWGYKTAHTECTSISILSGAKDGSVGVEVTGVRDNTVFSPERQSRSWTEPYDYIAVATDEDRREYNGRYWPGLNESDSFLAS